MPLKNCPECGQKVSTAALTCPNCGYPIKKVSKPLVSKPAGVVLQLAGAGALFWGGMGFLGETPDPTSAMVWLIVGISLVFIGGRTRARMK